MPDCINNEEHIKVMSETKAKVEILEKKTDEQASHQDKLNDVIIRLAVIQEQMVKDNAVRDKENKENAKVMTQLIETNKSTQEALDRLNKKLEEDIQKIHTKMDATDKKLDDTDTKLDGFINTSTSKTEIKKSKIALYGTSITAVCALIGVIIMAVLR